MMLEKLKSLNKKWYLLLALIILLGGGGGIAAKFYSRQQQQMNMQANVAAQMARSVEQDLVVLDNSSTLKLSPEQAKAILPLIEKMPAATTTSSPSINDLVKQVYEILTPVQYQTLTDYGKSVTKNIDKERQDGEEGNQRGERREFQKAEHNTKGIADPKTDAIQDIVIKMLKERSVETIKNQVS
ncbi:hypothetical protein [Desulfosporosinus sp. BG]|uniref:hypothetical protein n=1 Tax=Desulfosporosinus sp. BG TaxID=1633135 RepID=UPI000856B0CC|nr:hypothetical protein [Desulfosporosinus sp. BG]ODA38795.1 hypothetical protein DSBG_4424 [Desulfosporosinus sp. BG]